jgi:hypothetical protein
MGVEHYGQPPVFTFILELCNALFTTMFALGIRNFFFFLRCSFLLTFNQYDVMEKQRPLSR